MKWRARLWIGLPALLLSLLLVAGCWWLLETTAGARWALGRVPGLQVQRVQGHLLGAMDLQGLRWQEGGSALRVADLAWQWRPAALLWGELDLAELRLRGVRLCLPPSPTNAPPPALQWPALPVWARLLTLRVSRLQMDQVQVFEGHRQSLALQRGLATDLTWRHGRLLVPALVLALPHGRLRLSADVNLVQRHLQSLGTWAQGAALRVGWGLNWQGVQAGLIEGPFAVQMEGAQPMVLTGAARITPHHLNLSSLRLVSPILAQPAFGSALIALPQKAGEEASVATQWAQLLLRQTPSWLPTSALSLQLKLQGSSAHYAGTLTVAGDQALGNLRGALEGDAGGARWQVGGTLLGAQLQKSLIVFSWQPQIALQTTLAFRGLQPQRLVKAVPGDLSGVLRVDARQGAGGWSGEGDLALAPSTLYRQALSGQARVHFSPGAWVLKAAHFTGPGLDLSASGDPAQRLNFSVQVARWQGMVPGLAGTTQMSGWVAQRAGRWWGAIHGEGRALAYGGIRVSAVQVDAELSAAQALSAQLRVTHLLLAGHGLDLHVRAQGRLADFGVAVQAQWQRNRLDLGGQVQHLRSTWALALAQMAVHGGPLGDWRLQNPGTLRWARGGVLVSPLLFANGRGASVVASGRYVPSAQSGQVALNVHALPLDLHMAAAKVSLRGLLNARLQAHCQGVCQAQGQWQFAQTQLRWQGGNAAPQEIALQRFDGRLEWLPKALSLQADLALSEGFGSASVALHSPVTLALPWRWNGAAPLLGTVNAQGGPQLFAALPVGGLRMRKQGQGHLQLQVKGSWDAPQWSGSGQVQGVGFYVPQAGLDVQDVGFHLQGDGRQLRVSQISARSGQGQLQGQGTLDLLGPRLEHFAFHITGQDFSALNLPEVQAAVAPDLQVTGDLQAVQVDGSILTNRLRILGNAFGGPRPSNDVVFVKAAKKKAGPTLNVDLKVALGSDARVLIGGLSANLAGGLAVRMHNGQGADVEGTLHMVDGRYAIYGHALQFQRGVIVFHGPADQANLDVLAVRTIKNSSSFSVNNTPVQAGVQVMGTLQAPQVQLYSKPSMSQTDILSYLVLGTPSSGLQSQDVLLSAAAGELFSASRAALFGNALTGSGINVGVTSTGGLRGAMVTLGHYLTPDLYLSVGQSVLGSGTVARLRYRITRHIEAETESGTQNGLNLFYRIDFR
ncbi:MAG: translocation/assembly module TamB domain-containing protein [Acidithiobacillus sp.]